MLNILPQVTMGEVTLRSTYLEHNHQNTEGYESHVGGVGVEPSHVGPGRRGELHDGSSNLPGGGVDVSMDTNETSS